MEDVFGVFGQVLLGAVAAIGIMSLTMWLFFGVGSDPGPVEEYLLAVLRSAIGTPE